MKVWVCQICRRDFKWHDQVIEHLMMDNCKSPDKTTLKQIIKSKKKES